MSDSFKIINGNRSHRVSPEGNSRGNYKIAYSACPNKDPDMQVRKLTLPLVSSLNGKAKNILCTIRMFEISF